ncbi:MAG: phosphatidate cytidylyltransferase [Wenzhouxiangella sp.]
MLKTRFLTALVLAALGLLLLFLAPPPWFAALTALLLLGIGGREAGRLAGFDDERRCALFAGLLLAIGAALYGFASTQSQQLLLVFAAALWLVLLLWLTRAQAGRDQIGIKLFVLGSILLSAWVGAISLQLGSPWLVLMLVVIIAAADIGAYFTGRAIGGPKLAPSISPGKTRSGAIGGLLAAAVVAAIAAAVLPQAPFTPILAATIGLGLALVSIGGDLFISLLKRQRGMKDTSALLPGHGGVLDRFDSLGAALPLFALAWMWWGQ